MKMENLQRNEKDTIKKHQFILKVADEDIDELCRITGKVGLSPQNLLESFIGDLTGGRHSNGSDERGLVRRWFERCGFCFFPEKTFLRYTLEWGCTEYVLELSEEIEAYEDNITDIKEELANSGEEWQRYKKEDGTPYAKLEEWEREQQEFMAEQQELLNDTKSEMEALWNEFCIWTENESSSRTLEDELQKIKEWKEKCDRLKEEVEVSGEQETEEEETSLEQDGEEKTQSMRYGKKGR